MASGGGEITRLLGKWREGDPEALNEVMRLAYDDLRELARNQLHGKPPTLSSRMLVHEFYMRLTAGVEVNFRDRAHFIALASRMIRYIAVDYARAQAADKRGGSLLRVELPAELSHATGDSVDVTVLSDALKRLAELDPKCAELVELRFFGGLTMEETAEAMEISESTARRHWTFARTWLLAQITT